MKLMIERYHKDFFILRYKLAWWKPWRTLKHSSIDRYNPDQPPRLVQWPKLFSEHEVMTYAEQVTEATLFQEVARQHEWKVKEWARECEEWQKKRTRLKDLNIILKLKF